MTRQKRQLDAGFGPVLSSAAMKEAERIVRLVAAKEVTLTLLGESGTGKELLARRAHELSRRRHGPFIPINCAAIPDSLFESELFGHERGAFTGASDRARGKVEAATGGTLFLDEIAEMPLPMQAKMLRFLENLSFMRLGGLTKIKADIRLMCATLRPLEQEVQAGRFRADLYYRIQGITLRVPPLRERRADIAPLLSGFLAQLSALHGVRAPRLGRAAKAMLLRYDWPGNVRELRNVVETVCLLREGRQVRLADLPPALWAPAAPLAGPSAAPALVPGSSLASMICQIIEGTLAEEGGNKARAAARLQISLRTLQRHVAAGRVRAPDTGRPRP